MNKAFLAPALFLSTAILAGAASAQSSATVESTAPDPQELRRSVQTLVDFGTRHTLSSATDPKRGIGAARAWAAQRLRTISKDCGGCIAVETIGETVTGDRAPDGVRVEDVLGIQRGTGDPNRVVIVQGHIDSRVSDVMNITDDAPGANDDASGVALVLEAARLLSKEKFDGTIVYAALSGEEQGLYGAEILAKTAEERGWTVSAVLNNDVVGNSTGIGGQHVADKVRVFSEGIRAAADEQGIALQRAIGGEDDSPSRSLAKAIERVSTAAPRRLEVLAIRRPDRFRRGGDHIPFLKRGYPAVRFSEVAEHYDYQHQDLRTENGREYGDTIDKMDFDYLARVTALNMDVIRELASAPAAPATVEIEGAVSADTTVNWTPVKGAAGYRVHWRPANEMAWAEAIDLPAGQTETVLKGVIIDNNFFGVSALSDSGAESVVTFAGMPGGSGANGAAE
ncbi:MAG: peptidase M28 [Sphingorhabdus sp.]|nr:peptidase M28 [Sphingorhabdus sp.]|tara:strand:+ start:2436 stop:3794 length:1359 start_codon:yes stop_codon:yes gene_type:complete